MEVLAIDEELQRNERILVGALRKQLEDEAHAKAYEKIIRDTYQQKLTLEHRKAEFQEKFKDTKSLDEMKDTIRKLARIYQDEYKSLSLANKTKYIRTVVERIEMLPEEVKVVYRFYYQELVVKRFFISNISL